MLGFDFKLQNNNFIFAYPTTYKGCMYADPLLNVQYPKRINYIGFLVWMINKDTYGKLKVFQNFPNAIFYSKWQADAEILSVLLAASHFNYIIPIAIILCSIVVHICSHHAKGQHT